MNRENYPDKELPQVLYIYIYTYTQYIHKYITDPYDRAVKDADVRPLSCWERALLGAGRSSRVVLPSKVSENDIGRPTMRRLRSSRNVDNDSVYIYIYIYMYIYIYIGFKTFFYVVRHLHSIGSYLPTGLHLGFFRSWPSLFLPSSFSSVFLVLSFVSASTSMLFWTVFLLPFFEHAVPCELVLFNLFYNCFL